MKNRGPSERRPRVEKISRAVGGIAGLVSKKWKHARGRAGGKGTVQQVNYFEVDRRTSFFVRVYGELIEFQPHSMTVSSKGRVGVLESAYDLRQLAIPGTSPLFLRAFVHSRRGGKAKLYPLPPRRYYIEGDAVDRFPEVHEEYEAVVDQFPEVRKERERYAELRERVRLAWEMVRERVGVGESFASSVPPVGPAPAAQEVAGGTAALPSPVGNRAPPKLEPEPLPRRVRKLMKREAARFWGDRK
ncbi:MAG: hypothetical protein ACTSU5_01285 [Promethearchaeota archaeon]